MALNDIIRAGVAIANGVTAGVQSSITWEPWTGQDGYGKQTYASPVALRAIVDLTRKQRPTGAGKVVTIVATVTILQTITENATAGRHQPIDVRDRITLPDGTTGPIIEAPDAVLDPGTNRPFLNTVLIGEVQTAP